MKTLAGLQLVLILTFTIAVSAQSQETRDAIQDQRLNSVERQSVSNTASIYDLGSQITALRSSLDRFSGMVQGVGGLLAILQAVQVLLQLRNGKPRQ
jgi:hypothetical protein